MESNRTVSLDDLRALGFVDYFDTPRGKEVMEIVAKRMADDIEAQFIAEALK